MQDWRIDVAARAAADAIIHAFPRAGAISRSTRTFATQSSIRHPKPAGSPENAMRRCRRQRGGGHGRPALPDRGSRMHLRGDAAGEDAAGAQAARPLRTEPALQMVPALLASAAYPFGTLATPETVGDLLQEPATGPSWLEAGCRLT